MRKTLLLCGAFSPLVYIFMTILGGEMREGYSHSYHAVSELLEAGAPNKLLMDALLFLSNILSVLFGIAVLALVKESYHKRRIGIMGASLLIIAGVLGCIITLFFPMDPRSIVITFTGLMHLILVGVLSILGIVTPVFFAIWFRKQTDYVQYSTYSIITVFIILVTGGYAAYSAFTESPIMGLAERITIAANFQWTIVIALKMYITSK